jgi:ribosomal protein S18 acetylase RimI-like enzyme
MSLHVGCFVGGDLAGIASAVRRPMPGEPAEPAERAWQLRGMAVLPEFRRSGLGSAMVRVCISHVAGHGGAMLWCNARTPAARFYRNLGFDTKGEEFQVPVSGPHFVMWRGISPGDRSCGAADTKSLS